MGRLNLLYWVKGFRCERDTLDIRSVSVSWASMDDSSTSGEGVTMAASEHIAGLSNGDAIGNMAGTGDIIFTKGSFSFKAFTADLLLKYLSSV